MSEFVLMADGVFSVDPLCLFGGKNRSTGQVTFPCPDDEARFDRVELPCTGRLWSWTIQGFRPKSPPYIGPDEFVPFAVGYVELRDSIIVEARLVDVEIIPLKIGLEMELATDSFATASDGRSILTYAFRPTGAEVGQ